MFVRDWEPLFTVQDEQLIPRRRELHPQRSRKHSSYHSVHRFLFALINPVLQLILSLHRPCHQIALQTVLVLINLNTGGCRRQATCLLISHGHHGNSNPTAKRTEDNIIREKVTSNCKCLMQLQRVTTQAIHLDLRLAIIPDKKLVRVLVVPYDRWSLS